MTRITTAGFSYDSAGNQTRVPQGSHSYHFSTISPPVVLTDYERSLLAPPVFLLTLPAKRALRALGDILKERKPKPIAR